jgi:hypothetical protein
MRLDQLVEVAMNIADRVGSHRCPFQCSGRPYPGGATGCNQCLSFP